MKIAIASDHGGIELKSVLINHLQERNIEVIDCGTHRKGMPENTAGRC